MKANELPMTSMFSYATRSSWQILFSQMYLTHAWKDEKAENKYNKMIPLENKVHGVNKAMDFLSSTWSTKSKQYRLDAAAETNTGSTGLHFKSKMLQEIEKLS